MKINHGKISIENAINSSEIWRLTVDWLNVMHRAFLTCSLRKQEIHLASCACLYSRSKGRLLVQPPPPGHYSKGNDVSVLVLNWILSKEVSVEKRKNSTKPSIFFLEHVIGIFYVLDLFSSPVMSVSEEISPSVG